MMAGTAVLISGVAFLLNGYGVLNAATANLAAGFMLTLYGLAWVMHGVNICPACRVPPPKGK